MQERTKVTLKFDADGPEEPGPVKRYRLVRQTEPQTRRSDREHWQTDFSRYTHEVVQDGITRGQLAALIADAAEWLSYTEGSSD